MKKALLLLALVLPVAVRAQNTYDEGTSFGARASVEADVKLAKGLHLTVSEEIRAYSDDRNILRSYAGVGLEYKILPFLKAGAEYNYINRYQRDSLFNDNDEFQSIEKAWSTRHRGNFFLSGTFRAGDWQFGLKETLRLTHRTDDVNTCQSPRNALALKSKFTVRYRGLGKAVVPYAGIELRHALNDAAYSATYNASATKNKDRYLDEEFLGYSDAYLNRVRAQVGVSVKFNKHHAMDFYLLGDHYKDKSVDTNREGSDSWTKNGLVLKSIKYYTGNVLWGGLSYKFSF